MQNTYNDGASKTKGGARLVVEMLCQQSILTV